MLIGVLAQVESSLAPFLKPSEPEGNDTDEVVSDPAQAVAARTAARGGSPGAGQEDDLGVAISRDELGGDGEEEEEGEAGAALGVRNSSPAPSGRAPPKEKRREKGDNKGKKRSRADDPGSSRTHKPDKTTRPDSSRDEKKVKKKKKKKGGDEFDDLFSSLM